MMVDSKKYDASVSWREAAETELEVAGRPPDREEVRFLKDGDPVEALLETYDFEALHDRIMMAIATVPEGRLTNKPVKSARKEKLS